MYICLECLRFFNEPKIWTETHGLDTPPYETFYACPYCEGAFAKAHKCDCCGSWILGDYIKTEDGKRYCDACYTTMEIGDED